MNLNQLRTQAIPALLKAGITPCLMGDRGVGKTETVRQFCLENGYHLAEFRAGQASDGGDLTGLGSVEVTESGITRTVFALPNFLADIQKKDKVILFLDEFNRANRDIMQYLFELVYEKRIGINGFSLGKDSHVILSGNPNVKGMSVTNFDDFAFADRVCQIKVENSTAEWYNYCKEIKDIDYSVIEFFKDNPELITKSAVNFEIKATPSKRSALRLASLSTTVHDRNVFYTLASGMIGQEAAALYVDWLKNNETVSYKDVLGDFDKVADKLKMYAKGDRQDIIAKIISDIGVEAEARALAGVRATVLEHHNMAKFIEILSPDTSMAFMLMIFCHLGFLEPEDKTIFSTFTHNEDNILTSKRVFDKLNKDGGTNFKISELMKFVE